MHSVHSRSDENSDFCSISPATYGIIWPSLHQLDLVPALAPFGTSECLPEFEPRIPAHPLKWFQSRVFGSFGKLPCDQGFQQRVAIIATKWPSWKYSALVQVVHMVRIHGTQRGSTKWFFRLPSAPWGLSPWIPSPVSFGSPNFVDFIVWPFLTYNSW